MSRWWAGAIAWVGCGFAGAQLASAGPPRASAAVASCPAPQEAAEDARLPNVAGRLRAGATLSILVLGGEMPSGDVGLASQYSGQMARALEQHVPGLHVTLAARGRRGIVTAEAAALLRAAVKAHGYQLALWETGTSDAVRNVPPDEFYQALADGAAAALDAGTDLILVDPQFSRFLEANANLDPYLQAMQAAAALPGTTLFHRFDLMRDWEGDGLLDLEHAARPRRAAVAAQLHACLGRALADLVAAAHR